MHMRIGWIVISSGILCLLTLSASAQNLRDGIDQLAEQIIESAPEDRKIRLAVADFPDLLNVTSNLGRYVANKLTTRLSQSQKFLVVERQRLEQVLSELKFGMSDIVNPEKARKLGQIVGVEAIIVGTVSDLGSQVDLDARMIEIDTGQMIVSGAVTISKDQVVTQLMERGREERKTSTSSSMMPNAPPSGERAYQNPRLESFAKALQASAASLAKRTAKGLSYQEQAEGSIAEYNQLIEEAKPVFQQEPFIQALQPLKYFGNNYQAGWSVATAARGLEAYLESFSAAEGFKSASSSLEEYAVKGASYKEVAVGWISEYNRMIQEAKLVFKDNILVQSLKELTYSNNKEQASGAVASAAKKLNIFITPESK